MEEHAEEARKAGLDVGMERFEGSLHVGARSSGNLENLDLAR